MPTIQPPYGQTSIVAPNDDEIMSEANMMADALYFGNEYELDEEKQPNREMQILSVFNPTPDNNDTLTQPSRSLT